MDRSDKIKRGIATLAKKGFLQGESIVEDGSIGYTIIQDDPTTLQIRVYDPRKGIRYFTIKVAEHY